MRTAIRRTAIRRLAGQAAGLALYGSVMFCGCDSAPPAQTPEARTPEAAPTIAAVSAQTEPARLASVDNLRPLLPTTSPISPSTQSTTSAVQQTGYSGPPPLPSVAEAEFVPHIEDLQLFEQPDFSKYGKTPRQGWSDNADVGIYWTVGTRVRTNPLPHSP